MAERHASGLNHNKKTKSWAKLSDWLNGQCSGNPAAKMRFLPAKAAILVVVHDVTSRMKKIALFLMLALAALLAAKLLKEK